MRNLTIFFLDNFYDVNKQFPCQVFFVARTHEQVFCLKSKAGTTAVKPGSLSRKIVYFFAYTRANKTYQGKLVKENLLVCTGLVGIVVYFMMRYLVASVGTGQSQVKST